MSIQIPASTALALVLALPFWLAGTAQAVPIAFKFEGVLNQVNEQLGPPPKGIFQNDNPFFGKFAYESSTMAESSSRPQSAFYDALTEFRVTIQVAPSSLSNQTITFTAIFPSGAAGSIFMSNRQSNPPGVGGTANDPDIFEVQATAKATGSHIQFPVSGAFLRFEDDTATAFTPDDVIPALPTSLNLVQFNSTALFSLRFGDPSSPISVSGPVTRLDPAPVPEPTTLLLFGTTAAGLGLARWRQRKRGQPDK
jgi:PEP-CTERM motif-containing protein